jgi:sugar lactone lactonase YvrE
VLIQRHNSSLHRVTSHRLSQPDISCLAAGNAHDGPTNFAGFDGSAARRVMILAEYDWKGLTPASLPSESIRPRGLWQWALALLLFVFLLAAPLAQAQVAISGQVAVPQQIIAIAGGGTTVPSSTTPVPATSAKIGPINTAVDASGNVYFSDPTANLVERIDNSGNITVIAGGGSVVPNATPMLGTAAKLSQPYGLAVDGAGNVFIADTSNGLVEMWYPATQQIEVIAGGGSTVPTTTPEAATNAKIVPFKLALDNAGNIYIIDSAKNLIEKLDISGNIVLYAGGGSQVPSSTNSTTATSASIINLTSLAVDSKGRVYITDYNNSLIDMIYTASDSKQYVIVVAGGGPTEPTSSGVVSSLSAKLEYPTGIAVDSAGNLYVADGYGTIEKMRPAGNTFYVTVIAGAGQEGISSTAPHFPNDVQIGPYSVTVDGNGNLYLCDNRSALIELISAGTAFPATAVGKDFTYETIYVQLTSATPSMAAFGSAVASQAQDGGQDFDVVREVPITCPSVWTPTGHSPQCTIIVAFTPRYPGLRTGTLQLYNSTGTLIGTVGLSGTGMGPMGVFEPGYTSDLNIPKSDLSSPYAATVDGAGNLYIADHDLSKRVVKVTPTGAESVITIPTVAGQDIAMPTGIAIDGAGNMYLADHNNTRVVKMTPGGVASVVGLGGLSVRSIDGVAVDTAGDLFITDSSNNDIMELKSDGTLALVNIGSQILSSPQSIVVDGTGNLYIADYGNNRVVKVTPNGVSSVLSLPGVTMYSPEILALDGTGNLYIGDTYADVVEVTTSGDLFQLIPNGSTSPVQNLGALAADGAGIIYLTDVSASPHVFAMDRSSMALEFVSTDQGKTSTDSPKAVTYHNIGSAPLVIPTISYPADFPEAPGVSTDCGSHSDLSAGATCTFTIDFSPKSQGGMGASDDLSEYVMVNNNGATTFNGAQAIFVNGTETNIMPSAATPTVSPAFGTYDTVQTVTLSDTTTGAVIYYTTDGSTPTASSIKYTAPFTVSYIETIKAIAIAAGYANSDMLGGTYTINLNTAAPTFSPAAGTYTSAQSVTISDTTPGAAIYYTTDGSSPTLKSTLYSGPIQVGTSQTINAIALASGYSASAASTAVYTINLPAAATPTFSPVAGTYTSAQSVTIADSTTGAAIYYTTDGSTPTASSTKYTSAITVSQTKPSRLLQ